MRMWFGLIAVLGALLASAQAYAAESFRDCVDCPSMVSIPAGSFQMGSHDDQINWALGLGAKPEHIRDEQPQHFVSVNAFSMSATEVTKDQFDAFVHATGHQAGGPCWVWSSSQFKYIESSTNDWRDPGFSQPGDHPVVCVNYNDAKAYVRWLSEKTGKTYRLPSEAEWEYAARAGTNSGRYWGRENRDACRHANVADQTAARALRWAASKENEVFPCTDGNVFTAPVGQFTPNTFGLNDMLGNVGEWTEDCYNTSYIGAPTNGSAWLTGDCTLRVYRGGSWYNLPGNVRDMARVWDPASLRSSNRGFRVSRTN